MTMTSTLTRPTDNCRDLLDRLDAVGYTGRFAVHHHGYANIHAETDAEVRTALRLAPEWEFREPNETRLHYLIVSAVHPLDGSTFTSRWSIFAPDGWEPVAEPDTATVGVAANFVAVQDGVCRTAACPSEVTPSDMVVYGFGVVCPRCADEIRDQGYDATSGSGL